MNHQTLSRTCIAGFAVIIVASLPLFAHADTNSFSRNLELWDRGADIEQLQEFLNEQGFLVAQSGPGSPGQETDLFGLLTYHALLKYQAAHDLPATGYFGPETRAYIETAFAENSSQNSSSANSSGAGGASTASQLTAPSSLSPTFSPSAITLVSPGFGGGGGASVNTTPSCSLGADSPTITLGDSSLLIWSSTNAILASLTSLGSVPVSGSERVSPTSDTEYTLSVTGSSGASASCDTVVDVTGTGTTTPLSVEFTAPTANSQVAGDVTLSATTSDTVAVSYVQFKYATSTPTDIGSVISSAPYTTTWNSGSVPDGTYTLYAVAEDIDGTVASSSETVTVRNTPPEISSVAASSSSYTTATAMWSTDEPATSEVLYGLTTSYGSSSSSAAFVTSHSIILNGLTASSTYHYAVVSTDANGLTSTSSDQTFTTPATSTPPIISDISSGTPTTTAATITWTTDQSSNSEVVWGLTTSYGSSSSSASLVTTHSITISGLATSTTYHYAVVSANTFGATATSSDQTFTTQSGTPDYTPPTEPTDLIATPESSSQIDLTWTASTGNGVDACCSYQVFRDGTQVATSSTNSYDDTGLSPSTLHSYWIDAVDSANNISTTTNGVSAEAEAGADQFGTTWQPLAIGAGGLVSGIDIAPDGTMVIRTDTYGAYVWDGTQWDQLVTSTSMPSGDAIVDNDTGVYEIEVAPSDTNVFYMMYNGYLYRSDDRGATWTQTAFSQVSADANDNTKGFGPFIAIDPTNPDVAYAGTPSSGLWVTSDAGASWSQVGAIADATSSSGTQQGGGDLIAFDPTSSVVGGKTQGIYATSYGTGVYHSTDGGATWTLLNSSGMPTLPSHLVVAQDGVLYLTANDNTDNLYIYKSGAWSSVNVGGAPTSVAVDPSNANRIVVADGGGSLSVSSNHGASFTGFPGTMSFTATDIPWLAWALNVQQYMSDGNIVFDPVSSSTLYQAAGVGVWTTTPTNADSSITWNSQSIGIEQLVSTVVVSPPGGRPIVGAWDKPVFYVNDPNVYPSTYGPNVNNGIVMGWDFDYAKNDPTYIAGIMNWWGVDESGYSNDGGQTWTPFTSIPSSVSGSSDTVGGGIAVASSTDIVWFPSDNSNPYYSLDGGASWDQISMPGVPTTGETGWGSSYYFQRHIVTADTVNIGTFYAYNYGPTGDASAAGVYKSTDGGVTWTQVYSGQLTAFSDFNAKLKAAPGMAGNLFFTPGAQSAPHPASFAYFEHSTDGGATWNAVPNVLEVRAFGFGKAAPGTTTPAIYIVGWVNNVYGIYESDDDANTWSQIGLWPANTLDDIITISGDMNAYGRVYLGFDGSGFAYGDTANAQIPPLINSISSGTPAAASATITWTTDQAANSEIVYGTTAGYGSSASSGSLVTSHSVTLTGLTSGTTYHFEVVSADASGYTSTSTDQIFTTFNANPPSVPTDLTATATSSSEIDLSWNASTGNGTYSVAGYKVYRNSAQIATTSSTTYRDMGLYASTTYAYSVAAYDTAGNVSAQTATTNGTTLTCTPNPIAIDSSAKSDAVGNTTSIHLTLSTTKKNDVLIAYVGGYGAPVVSVSDTAGLTWTRRAAQYLSGNPFSDIEEWYAIATSTLSSDTITATQYYSNFEVLEVFAVSGANTMSPFDPNSSLPAGSISTPSISTSYQNDLIFAGFRDTNNTGTNGAGWTALNPSADWMINEYVIASTTQSNLPATISGDTIVVGIGDAVTQACNE